MSVEIDSLPLDLNVSIQFNLGGIEGQLRPDQKRWGHLGCKLLGTLKKSEEMSFGDYAQAYAQYLREQGAVERAAESVLLGLARNRLPVFYCVDPYIPDYGKHQESISRLPYEGRSWHPAFRLEGCHRVVLSGELVRFFIDHGILVNAFEIDQTFREVHERRYAP